MHVIRTEKKEGLVLVLNGRLCLFALTDLVHAWYRKGKEEVQICMSLFKQIPCILMV
jgi:hypothetical protein